MLKSRTLKIFGLRRREVTRGYRKLCKKELQNVYSSLSIIKDKIKKDEVDKIVTHLMEKRNTYKFFETNTYKILARQPEEKRPLGRPMNGWENNIKVYHKKG
jgi:hypothetical protein